MRTSFVILVLAIMFLGAAAVRGNQNVSFKWTQSPSGNVIGYNVYYGRTSGVYEFTLVAGNTTEVIITNLADGVTYYFAVAAHDASRIESELSNEVFYSVPGLSPPGGINSIFQTPSQEVTVRWIPSSSPNIDYHLYYGIESTNYIWSTFVSGTNEISLSGLQAGVTYYFAVAAYDSSLNQESSLTSEVSFTVPTLGAPGPITSIEASPDAGLIITWNPSSDGATVGYNVYYAPEPNNYYWLGASVSGTNQTTVYGLAAGVSYRFLVKAYDSNGQESSPSPETSYTVPLPTPPGPITSIRKTDNGVTVRWEAAQNPAIRGYYVCYGTYSGYYYGISTVADTNELTIWGLDEGQTYYFTVMSYDAAWQFSVLSPEVSFTVPVSPPVLTLQKISVPGLESVFAVSAGGTLPPTWSLEASTDLQVWNPLLTSSDTSLNATVVVAQNPRLFFRLNTWFEGVELQMHTDTVNAFPDSFFITTPDSIPWYWTMEFSDDLQNWSSLASGADSRANVAVIHRAHPQLFFRLKGE